MDEIRRVQLQDIYRPLRCTGDDCPKSCAECKKMAMVALSILSPAESEGRDAALLDFGFSHGIEFGMAHSVTKKSELSKIWAEARSQALATPSSEKASRKARKIIKLLRDWTEPDCYEGLSKSDEANLYEINRFADDFLASSPVPSNKGAPDGPTD